MPDGLVQARRFSWPESLCFVVLTPEVSLATGESRAVLPQCVSRADVVFNLQRAALLLQSLHSGDFSLLRHAMRDRLHQPSRQNIVPCLAQALELEHPDLLGVCLSGSGPSVVAIAERSHREIGQLLGSVTNAPASATAFGLYKPTTSPARIFRCSAPDCCVAETGVFGWYQGTTLGRALIYNYLAAERPDVRSLRYD